MSVWIFLPPLLGVTVLCQAILNRQFSESLGLATAVMINATVFFIASALLWISTRMMPELFPEFLKPGAAPLDATLTLVVPGLCGFLLVLGAPWALQKVGPSKTFVLLVGSQIIASVLADRFVFGLELDWTKWLGSAIVLLGVLLVTA